MNHELVLQTMFIGYLFYQSIWDAACDRELLSYERQPRNQHDSSIVAVKKGSIVVGHVLRVVSTICSIFIWRECIIVCLNTLQTYS